MPRALCVRIGAACPHRLEAQDVALSRPKPGFESPWGHHIASPCGAACFCGARSNGVRDLQRLQSGPKTSHSNPIVLQAARSRTGRQRPARTAGRIADRRPDDAPRSGHHPKSQFAAPLESSHQWPMPARLGRWESSSCLRRFPFLIEGELRHRYSENRRRAAGAGHGWRLGHRTRVGNTPGQCLICQGYRTSLEG